MECREFGKTGMKPSILGFGMMRLKRNEDGSLNLNPNSRTVLQDCMVEPALATAEKYDSFQFVRQGFFCVDAKDSTPEHLVFNRIVSLKSSYKLPSQS